MNHPRPIRHLLTLGVVVALSVLALSRCLAIEAKLGPIAAPYFELKGGERFLLDSTEVEVEVEVDLEVEIELEVEFGVRVEGVTAHVTLRQVFHHRGTTPLEANYVFPTSPETDFQGVIIKIGDRATLAQFQDGPSTPQMEGSSPKGFQMTVRNILPGERVEVISQYAEDWAPRQSSLGLAFTRPSRGSF